MRFNLFIILSCCMRFYTVAQDDYSKTVVNEGIQVDFSLTHYDKSKPSNEFREGDDVTFTFKISDTITKTPLSGAFPAAWMDKINSNNTDCGKKIVSFIEGGILSRPELDLNVYYVLTLNNDNTINVVDPLFGFGGSKLLNQIQLSGTGYDWEITENQMSVFVSIPEASEVAVISTSEMKNTHHITIPGKPKKMQLQPDERYLWVVYDLQGNFESSSGVAVIDTEKNELVKTITTGSGEHDLCISKNGKYVFVSNQSSGNVSIISSASLEKIKDVTVTDAPIDIAYSSKANAVYVVNKISSTITVIDGANHTIIKEINPVPGVNKIDFTPDGRFGFALNPRANTVDIIDVSTNRVIQTADVEDHPDEVSFTDELAYIRHLGSEIVWMIALDVIGFEGRPVPIIDFSGGQNPPALGVEECGAKGIIQAPGANAVLVSNYKDESIYYYSEGMAAPSGQFNTYGKRPKAVQVIDKSIEEVASGTYQTTVRLRTPGEYDVSLFLDVPSFMECFPVTVLPNKELEKERLSDMLGPLSIKYLAGSTRPIVGEEIEYKFELRDVNTQDLVPNLKDVKLMSSSSAGTNHHPITVTESGTKGIYKLKLKFEKKGLFYMYIECPSRGLTYNNPQFLVVYASEGEKTE